MKTPNIEFQISELELRHKAHQRMLVAHHDAKHERRERHRARRFGRSIVIQTLV